VHAVGPPARPRSCWASARGATRAARRLRCRARVATRRHARRAPRAPRARQAAPSASRVLPSSRDRLQSA
jgi:hypothetical protein